MNANGTVLVVEDDEAIQELIESILRLDGYNVVCASDGLEALREVERIRPEIILLDMGLPNMDGEAFIETYHQTPSPHAPIIGVSAYQIDPDLVSKLSGFIKKPFDIPQLRAVIQDVRQGYAHA
jgi:CheY-like chemotaxis protein